MPCAASCHGGILDWTDPDADLHPLGEAATAMVPDDATAEYDTSSARVYNQFTRSRRYLWQQHVRLARGKRFCR